MPPIKFWKRLTKFMISLSLSEKLCCSPHGTLKIKNLSIKREYVRKPPQKLTQLSPRSHPRHLVGKRLVGCFELNGRLREYYCLYRAVSQRDRKKKIKTRENVSKQPPPSPTASKVGPCPSIIQISRTPWHWKFTQHHRTTPLGKRTAQKYAIKDITSDSQVNSYFLYRWSPAKQMILSCA